MSLQLSGWRKFVMGFVPVLGFLLLMFIYPDHIGELIYPTVTVSLGYGGINVIQKATIKK